MSIQTVVTILAFAIYAAVFYYCLQTRLRYPILCRFLQFCTGFGLTYVIGWDIPSGLSTIWFALCLVDGILNMFAIEFHLRFTERK